MGQVAGVLFDIEKRMDGIDKLLRKLLKKLSYISREKVKQVVREFRY
jgi:hypothetical protein